MGESLVLVDVMPNLFEDLEEKTILRFPYWACSTGVNLQGETYCQLSGFSEPQRSSSLHLGQVSSSLSPFPLLIFRSAISMVSG